MLRTGSSRGGGVVQGAGVQIKQVRLYEIPNSQGELKFGSSWQEFQISKIQISEITLYFESLCPQIFNYNFSAVQVADNFSQQ